jgi:lipopolysaccharide transport system ATP-binding protein
MHGTVNLKMSGTIIRAVNLSKRYTITVGHHRHDTLRDQIADGVRHLLGRNGDGRGRKETFWALKDVSFEVNPGEVVGLIGENGAGKSTLLKILSRITAPTVGTIDIHGRVGSLLEVGTGFHPELSGRENIYLNGAILGMKKSEIDRKFDEIVAFSEIEKFIDTPVKRYSSGMYVRLAFAVAAHLEPEVLLVDEVLAVGDAAFQKKCLGKMEGVAREGRTVLFVSHNMAAVEHLCNKVFLLQHGQLTFSGDAEDGIDRYLAGIAGDGPGSACHAVDLTLASGRPKQVRALLKRLELFNGDGKPSNGNIQIGGSFKARVSFRLEKPSALFDVILGIDNHLGQRVFTASSEFQPGRPEEVRQGNQVMICEIPSLLLVPGEYRIKVVLNLNGYAADWVENATRINVIASDYYKSGKVPKTGMVVLGQSWNLEPNSSS